MLLHVVLGPSSAGALRQALGQVGDIIVPLRDSLCVGPLPAVSSLEQWATVRQRFWEEVYDGRDMPPEGLLPDLGSFAEAEQIVLWVGRGLDEQLLLPWLCWMLGKLGVDRARLGFVELTSPFPDRAPPHSAGMLSCNDLRQQPAPVRLSAEQVSLMDRVWGAVTSPSPAPLVEWLRSEPGESPLACALVQLARRYPQRGTGLSAWDHALLSNTLRYGPRSARIVAYTLAAPGSELDPMGDVWLFWRLGHLARARCPLLALDGDPSQLRTLWVSVTDAGRRVLECRENAVTLNGIDEWAAGVHLDSSANRVWFADGNHISC